MDGPKTLMTREEAGDYLGIKPQTLATWAMTGRYGLPLVKIGRSVRYRREALDQFILARSVCRSADLE